MELFLWRCRFFLSSQTYDSDFLGDCCSLIAWRQDGSGSTRNPLARIQCHPAGESWRSKHGLCSLYMPGRGYETRWKPMVNCTKVLEVAGELKRSAHLAGPHLPDWARMSLIRCYFHTVLPPPSLSLSSSSSYSLILNDHSMESEYRLFVLFPSLSLCDLLIVMACRWATNPPWHAKSPSLLPPTGWRTYKTRSCRKSDIWNFHMLLHTIILLLSKSCREVDCLFSVPFYATYLLLLHHGLGFECSPETGSCKREVLWLC